MGDTQNVPRGTEREVFQTAVLSGKIRAILIPAGRTSVRQVF